MPVGLRIMTEARGLSAPLLRLVSNLWCPTMSNTRAPSVAVALSSVGVSRLLEAGEVLHVEGAVVDTVAVVVTGALVMAFDPGATEPVARLSEGDVVSLAAFITRAPIEAFVVAQVQTELRVVDRRTFNTLMRGHDGFSRRVLEFVSRHATQLESREWRHEQARLRHRAEGLFDPSTSAHSRRWLTQALPRFVARHEQGHEPLCAMVFNLDHLKQFNDQYGFEAGHDALRVVATTTFRSLRVTDRLVRVGGEEFVVLLPFTTLDEGAVAAERLRAAIASAPLVTSPPARVTVSLGVACHVIGAEPGAFIEAARVAMFDAKRSGRNQVALSSPASQ